MTSPGSDAGLPLFSPSSKRTKPKSKDCFSTVPPLYYVGAVTVFLFTTIILGSLLTGANKSNAEMRNGLDIIMTQAQHVNHLLPASRQESQDPGESSSVGDSMLRKAKRVSGLLAEHAVLRNSSHEMQIEMAKVRTIKTMRSPV